jgi:hypothetical protein
MHCLIEVMKVMGTLGLAGLVVFGWMHLCYKVSGGSTKGLAVCVAGILFALMVLLVVVNCAVHS